MSQAVDPAQSFPALEEEILRRWRDRDVFRQSIERRAGAEPWVFYEGPPTANGMPGSHHVLARAFKDIYPRFRTMRGYRVERKGGWDCHGLPVEIQVEKELGLHNKNDIEAYGIEAFNQKCRESVFTFLEEWDRLTERIGFWVDLEHPYRTLDASYVESVWWALKTLSEKDLLFEGHKVVPYCTRCGTALSSHEVAQGYKDVVDQSVYVKLPVTTGAGPVVAGDQLLVWTTTPWTLPSNAAVAVAPELEYVRASAAGSEEVCVLAAGLVERVLGEGAVVHETFAGETFEGARYDPPFHFIASSAWGERAHSVLPADFVTADDGTGIVHTAIAFGEDDYRLGTSAGLTVVNPVGLDGRYDERITDYAGRHVKDVDGDIVDRLRADGRLLKVDAYEHSYPHCWRCGTPLIYYAKPSWFVGTSGHRQQLLDANETIGWHPEHIKHGRFGNWLENNIDWAVSRERYWGTPLPVWRSEDGADIHVVGSLAELEELSGVKLDDPHRPFVDDVTFPHPVTGATLTRVPEVIDVWFDSGCMPFAQHHAPIDPAGQATFEDQFPAQYICEAIDQTRGWFYSLLAVNTLLFDRAPYENVVCLGHIRDENDEKMSKSKGNIVEPMPVIDQYGADAFRWYFFTSKQPWDGYRFSTDAIGEGVRLFLRQLWNTYAFLQLYRVEDVEATETELDRWVLSRLAATVEEVTERLDAFDATFAGRAIGAFVDDLSNWYVRRSRPRFFAGDPGAFATLRECLETVSRLLAPFTPFISDAIFCGLTEGDAGALDSVHLADWPVAGPRDLALEEDMAIARDAVRLGLKARGMSKIKVRQPLAEAVIVATGREREAIGAHDAMIRDELNVRALRFIDSADELGSYELKANYRALGPRFGKHMPAAAAAIAALDAGHVAAAIREGRTFGVFVDGREHELGAEDVSLVMQPLEGYEVEREGNHAVALDLTIDEDLRREGWAREVVRAVQNLRKDSGLNVGDRITLALEGDEALVAAATEWQAWIAGEVLATAMSFDGAGDGAAAGSTDVSIDGLPLHLAIRTA
ncbi:isoleucine--tRNA ligase [Paraconexibacter antarcticus]|uniref:Isoleucine--tRNA ligase n=1 Tax=Paraconexibacter antarcticus TaxID=2949664 RepID=A0ABY5DQZ9_9ACTN|nr:isoleucine--tRNA ligase [Paraconexibacter antarcticus]UTI64458.1 isoleucine--tRNA ligase [Paraconexibacter antarcticus]